MNITSAIGSNTMRAMAENRHRYRQRNRERVLEHLQTNPCVDCGERDVAVLEFDHVETKFENVSRLIAIGSSWSTLSAEIAKCVVRPLRELSSTPYGQAIFLVAGNQSRAGM
jgi:hypothetical protein